MSFEQEIKCHLSDAGIAFEDHTSAVDLPDFKITKEDCPIIHLEVKEKKSPYNIKNWPIFESMGIDEKYSFIEDELSVRRLCYHGPHSFLLVKDVASSGFLYVWSLIGLFCIPKKRTNRKVGDTLKGKWLMDFRWGRELRGLEPLIPLLFSVCDKIDYVCDQLVQHIYLP